MRGSSKGQRLLGPPPATSRPCCKNRLLLSLAATAGIVALAVVGILAAPRSGTPAPAPAPAAPRVRDLWLARPALPDATAAPYARRMCAVRCGNSSAHSALATACAELAASLSSMLGRRTGGGIKVLPVVGGDDGGCGGGGYALVRLSDDAALPSAEWSVRRDGDSPELEAFTARGRGLLSDAPTAAPEVALEIVSPTGRGALFGVHRLLSFLQVSAFAQQQQPQPEESQRLLRDIDLSSAPGTALRMWQLWDNLDGTVERGYGGRSVFHWEELPGTARPRYDAYARALASVGINAVSLSNVNACFAENKGLLNATNLAKAAALAAVFARHGIATVLAVCFASPMIVEPAPGAAAVDSADPHDPAVAAWWAAKAAQVGDLFAAASPLPWRSDGVRNSSSSSSSSSSSDSSFGGLLLKADSEGMAGPAYYNRTEPEGANMLAAAVLPLRGLVLWRAFAHPADLPGQRGKDQPGMQYDVFAATDGLWHGNVVLQIKNGPMDFQIHEPVHSLFGALPNTNVMLELGVTQEYSGQAVHLAHLAPQWEEYLAFDTRSTACVPAVPPPTPAAAAAAAPAATLANIVGGKLPGCPARRHNSGIAGVSNLGESDAWTGHPLAAANTFCFGRMGWDAAAVGAELATAEWLDLSFAGLREAPRRRLLSMLLRSWGVFESYTSPLGLGAVCDNCGVAGGKACGAKGDHYWLAFDKWQATRKPPNAGFGGGFNGSSDGIGLNRSSTYGATYYGANAAAFARPETTPQGLLLTFHHVPLNFSVTLPWTVAGDDDGGGGNAQPNHAAAAATSSSLPLVQALYAFYARGLGEAVAFRAEWDAIAGPHAPAADAAVVGAERYALVARLLADAAKDAHNFTLTAARYFEQLTGVPPFEHLRLPAAV